MLRARVIPCLLLLQRRLVKTVKFKSPRYVGDPINAVRIFNDKEVDELVVLDIGATPAGAEPDFELLENLASEAFMPFAYGGGIRTVDQIRRLYSLGIEKIILNTAAASDPDFVAEAVSLAGSSSVVVSIDVRRNWRGKSSVWTKNGTTDTGFDPVSYARRMASLGAGEILLTAIDRDGMMEGYDLPLVRAVTEAVDIPVIAAGGAGNLEHLRGAVENGAAAVAAGSMFVFHGKHRAVLITYPDYTELVELFGGLDSSCTKLT